MLTNSNLQIDVKIMVKYFFGVDRLWESISGLINKFIKQIVARNI